MQRRDFIKLGLGAAIATVLPPPECVKVVGGFTPRAGMTIIALNRYRQMSLDEWLQEIGLVGRFRMSKYQEKIIGAVQAKLDSQLNS